MALTAAQIDLRYEEVLARHATPAEQQAFAALSLTQSNAQIDADIATLPEATSFVDPIVRLYQGAFGRLPDTIDPNGNFDTGAQSGYWVNVNAFRSGVSLVAMAEAFVASAEFHNLYGTTTVTPALITAFYQHILGRDPAGSEVAAWQATGLDAAHILLGFTQSTEFVNSSQPFVDQFKEALAEGQHPNGPLPSPGPDVTLVSDHDATGVNEGSTVTFTLQSTNPADFGHSFSYNISGIDAARIAGGQLVGTVTLDSLGLAHIAVTVLADNKTDGPTTMTMAVGSLTDNVAVNDTSLTPAQQFFTQTVGETLVGGPANTEFVGTVDTKIVGNNTLSNVVDVAKGDPNFHNTETIVISNSDGTNITPKSTGVQELKVINLDASASTTKVFLQNESDACDTCTPVCNDNITQINAAFMKDVNTISMENSTVGANIYNLQNFISTINISETDNPGGLFLGVIMVDNVVVPAGGVQLINLTNAGAGNGIVLEDETTSGNDVVGTFVINAVGTNDLTIDGTGAATAVLVADSGSGDTTTLHSLDDTENLTTIDTSFVSGTVTFDCGWEADEGNTLTVTEGNGTNIFNLSAETGSTVIVNGQDGTDTLNLDFTDSTGGQTVQVTEGNGNDTLNVDNCSTDCSDNQTVTASYGSGNNDLNVSVGMNSSVTLSATDGQNYVNVNTMENATVNVTLGNGANTYAISKGVYVSVGEGSSVTVKAGNGGDDVTINTLDTDCISGAPDVDGHQTYTVTLGTGANTLNITTPEVEIQPAVFDDSGVDDSSQSVDTSVEPDAVIASNQLITVSMGVGGAAAQAAYIETGVNSTVSVTTGDGDSTVKIEADNTVYTHSISDDTVTQTGAGGSQVTVATGNGNNDINVNLVADGTGNDAGSGVKVTTGSGNDSIVVDLGTAGGTGGIANTANVSTGAGNDRVQFDVPDINAGIVANGGNGTDTIALVSTSAGAGPASLAGLSNFEILEVTDTLHNSVNLDSYEPANNINHVILDMGFSGTHTISGAEQNFQLDLMAGSAGQNLIVLVDNAVVNTNDAVGIKLDANSAGTTDFGTVNLNPIVVNVVENVTIDSTTQTASNVPTAQNNFHLADNGLQTLTILHDAGGDVTLDLDGSTTNFGGSALTSVQAATFTGGIIWDDAGNGLGNDNNNITFNAPVSGNDSLNFGNGNDTVTLGNGANNVILGNGNDTVTLGGGTNSVTIGSGTDSITAGDGNNTVTIANATSHLDTVTLGSGTNTVTLQGAGGSGSSINFAAHGANIDTVNFNAVAESMYSLPDTITGFQAGSDILHFNAAMFSGSGATTSFDFVTVSSQVAALAVAASDSAVHETFIYDSSTGHLYIDGNSNQALTNGGADMEIVLVGIPHITAANIQVA